MTWFLSLSLSLNLSFLFPSSQGVDVALNDSTDEVMPFMSTAPRSFPADSAVKFKAGATMIDGLMTELCKSYNPFIKLNGGDT